MTIKYKRVGVRIDRADQRSKVNLRMSDVNLTLTGPSPPTSSPNCSS